MYGQMNTYLIELWVWQGQHLDVIHDYAPEGACSNLGWHDRPAMLGIVVQTLGTGRILFKLLTRTLVCINPAFQHSFVAQV